MPGTSFDATDLPAFEPPEFEEEQPDEDERPPLRGTTTPPAGMDEVDWASLEDAYDTADQTPLFIEAITSDDAGDRNFGLYGLYSATTHQGSVYTASEAAIPFLAESVRHDNALAVQFLARIAVGETHFVTRPDDLRDATSRYAGVVAEFAADVEAMWVRTGDDEALRLLVLLGREPSLPALTPDASASLCLAHGFAAARANGVTAGVPRQRDVSVEHVAAARDLMTSSPSLHVRCAAAVSIVYSGFADEHALALLHHLAQGEYRVFDAWTGDFAELAAAAWTFGTTDDGLLATPSHTNPPLHSRLLERMTRQFRRSGEVYRPVAPEELTDAQRLTLETALRSAPETITGADVTYRWIDVPGSVPAARRLLGTATGELTRRTSAGLLWFVLEDALLASGDTKTALAALAEVDAWTALGEVFAAPRPDSRAEKITLTVRHLYGDGRENAATLQLCSTFADALAGHRDRAGAFLDEWLPVVSEVEGHDLAFQVPGQRIGTALAALARSGGVPEHFHPMVKPYHRFPRYSTVPLPLLREIAEVLPPDVRAARLAEWAD
ncbi:hypothetical protein [Lentzea sp. NBRC 102530]|uniref:hypothetical protein n=1 Tax=Lentzea sp. NBRC 102530 TaxID=3032201 RepID=UPI0024A1A111|nr:hypothetical protein [Lentzea sp. NBRC 102530]GLY50641.1 hypothetical protein Lesp01_42970 [Lentzea sp. NBRC 102530]